MRPVIEALEPRRFLSGTLVASTAERADAPVMVERSLTATGLTITDRKQLISHLTDPLASSLRKTLRHSGPSAFDATLLHYMIRRQGPAFFFNPKRLPEYVSYINQNLSGVVPQTLTKADAVLSHQFPEQLNSDSYSIQLPTAIDWDASPKATSNPNFLHALNRHTFWKDLSVAFRLTGDGKYVRELVSELQSWSAQTPALKNPDDWAKSGPGWWLLNAADRASNWTYAYFMVLGSADWTPAANTLFLKEIWQHGDFLSRVTPSSYAKNRTALHAAGLLRIGMLFPEFKSAGAWENQGADMTFRSLAAQFFPDGGHVEETPAYAGAALDAFLENYRLAEANGRTFWTKNRRKMLQNGVEALYQLLTVDGAYTALSDTYRGSNPRGFLTRAALTLGTDRYILGRINVEDVFLLSRDHLNFPATGQGVQVFNRGPSYALPDSGYYMLRGAYEQQSAGSSLFSSADQVVFDAGPKGGTHGHFDLLSFEFQQTGIDPPPIPDPGPFTYDDSADRQWIISTPAHNTISIDAKNHEAVEGAHNPKIAVDAFETANDHALVTAHHHAYEYLDGQPTVGRTLWMDRTPNNLGLLVVVDWARSNPNHPHTFTTSLNLADKPVTEIAPNAVDVSLTRLFHMRVQTISSVPLTSAVADTFISNNPPPDAKTPAKQFRASETGTSALFVTVISEYFPTGFNPTQPAAIAFESPPRKGQPVRLRLTMQDGSVRSLEFAAPNLMPLPDET